MSEDKKNVLWGTAKGVGISVIAMLIGVLVFALIIKIASLSPSVIKPVNQFIKAIALFLGCFFSISGSKGYLKGAVSGLISVIIIYLIFALIGGENLFGLNFLIDLAFGLIVGAISGIISVNIKK